MPKTVLPVAWDILQPNAIAETRMMRGYASLMALSRAIPSIPYARLYKLEKGTSIARDSELDIIARTLRTKPDKLVLAPMTASEAQAWAEVYSGRRQRVHGGDEQAVTLAAAIRATMKRKHIAPSSIVEDYRLPYVTYHKMINAERPIDRWSPRAMTAIIRLMGARDWDGVILASRRMKASGQLDALIREIVKPRVRFHPDDPDPRSPWTQKRPTGMAAVERHPVMTPAQRHTRYRQIDATPPRAATASKIEPKQAVRFPRQDDAGSIDERALKSARRILPETGSLPLTRLARYVHENSGVTLGQAVYSIRRLVKNGAIAATKAGNDVTVHPRPARPA